MSWSKKLLIIVLLTVIVALIVNQLNDDCANEARIFLRNIMHRLF